MGYLYKYSDETVISEADMFLSGARLKDISAALGIPKSTISWHLIHPLKRINFDKWVEVRTRLNKFAKDEARVWNDYMLVKRLRGRNIKEGKS